MRHLGTAAAAAIALALARPAAAGGSRFPASNAIVFSPTDPNMVLARTTYGLLPSTDDGATWSYVCPRALGLPMSAYEDPLVTITPSGTVLAGLLVQAGGLDVSTDVGCSWSCAGGALAGQQIADVVARPGAAHEVLALTSAYVDAGSTYTTLVESADDGATWTALGSPLDPGVVASSLRVAPSDPERLYVATTRGYGSARTASLFVSSDGAATWTEHPIAAFLGDAMGGEARVLVAAVDPVNEDRVYLRSEAYVYGGSSRLYVTSDAGGSYRIATAFADDAGVTGSLTGELLSFALSPDGSTIFVGTEETGLWRASSADLQFVQVNAGVGVQCLATRQTAQGPELWACASEYKGGFVVGASTDEGVRFGAKLPTLTSLSGMVACGANPAGTGACGSASGASLSCSCDDYVNVCTNDDAVNACRGCGQAGVDAGLLDAAADAPADAGRAAVGKAASCGCRAVGGGRSHGLLAAWLLGAAARARRRRRTESVPRRRGAGRARRAREHDSAEREHAPRAGSRVHPARVAR